MIAIFGARRECGENISHDFTCSIGSAGYCNCSYARKQREAERAEKILKELEQAERASSKQLNYNENFARCAYFGKMRKFVLVTKITARSRSNP